MSRFAPIEPPHRLLLGPGPSPVDDRVMRAMGAPVLGHLDPAFIKIMDEVQAMLREVFETSNRLTIPISGTGSAGMEAAIVNLIEPGDEVVVGINGYFGERMAEMVRRAGGTPIRVECAWGGPLDLDKMRDAWTKSKARVLFAVHAETSTGVRQDLTPLRAIVDSRADDHGGFLLVDAVTSLGGHRVEIDRHGIDACYSGTQKALSCPPGLSPVTFSDRAVKHIQSRKTPVGSWYLDTNLITAYWHSQSTQPRAYHHTAPISMNYALHEALRLVLVEGLEARARRHERNHRALVAGVEAMGLAMAVPAPHRLWTLNTISIPDGVDDGKVRARLLSEFNIEVGGGLGAGKGKVWRVGLMGAGSSEDNVLLFLSALEGCLAEQGFNVARSGSSAASAFYAVQAATKS